jgi:hypothetical protein
MDRDNVHGATDNALFTRKVANMKQHQTFTLNDTEPFCNFKDCPTMFLAAMLKKATSDGFF